MAAHHVAEETLRWAIVEGGVGGSLGAVVGAVLGWPHSSLQPLGNTGLNIVTYHNAFSSGAFEKVLATGFGGCALVAAIGAVAGLGWAKVSGNEA